MRCYIMYAFVPPAAGLMPDDDDRSDAVMSCGVLEDASERKQ
jgi:hypothetical protein